MLARVREVISTAEAPSSPLYSQGVKTGEYVHVSGMVGVDVRTGNLAGPTIQEQTRQALTNCRAVLHTAGATMEDVVEVGVLLTDPADFAGMNDEYATWEKDKTDEAQKDFVYQIYGSRIYTLWQYVVENKVDKSKFEKTYDGVKKKADPLNK